MMSTPLEDYALIGDCETAALVSRSGSIDWLCWPRFDSAACFAALLGSQEHGRWLIETTAPGPRVSRRYRGHSLILETRMETGAGAVTLIDFMPPRGRHSDIVRLVRGDRGRVPMRTELILRFDYGRTVPWVTRLGDGTVRAIAGPDMVTLRTAVPLHGRDLTTIGDFEVAEGQIVPFVLTHAESHLPPPHAIDPHAALSKTERFWREWVSTSRVEGEWSDAVTRSLVILKALTYAPTGGIVAAADDFAARGAWRAEELGLSLLLAARRHADPAGAHERGVLQRGARLARLAAARRGRARRRNSRSCTAWRASAGSRSTRCRGCPATSGRSPSGSEMPHTDNCSSTCSAR